MKILLAGGLLCGCVAAASALAAPAEASAPVPVAESVGVQTLAPATPHRLYVLDTAVLATQAGRTWIIDGDKTVMEGMFYQGHLSNFAVSPDGTELYSADSYWEKHTRGRRSDYVVVRDARTLEVKADVPLPLGRFLIYTKKHNFEITPDGRYALSYNLVPASSASVVDLRERRYLGEVELPGCGLLFASAANRFSSICADGRMVSATFDSRLTASLKYSPVFFPSSDDPVYEHAGWDKPGKRLYLLSYAGLVYPVDVSSDTPKPAPAWNLTEAADRAAGWRPGGWQPIALHRKLQRLYVLMHVGAEWSHKTSGEEVWVVDATTHRRLQRIPLKDKAQAVAVSQDAKPLLYLIGESSDITILDALNGAPRGVVSKLGISPQVLYVQGE